MLKLYKPPAEGEVFPYLKAAESAGVPETSGEPTPEHFDMMNALAKDPENRRADLRALVFTGVAIAGMYFHEEISNLIKSLRHPSSATEVENQK